jgi:hypothetical protein
LLFRNAKRCFSSGLPKSIQQIIFTNLQKVRHLPASADDFGHVKSLTFTSIMISRPLVLFLILLDACSPDSSDDYLPVPPSVKDESWKERQLSADSLKPPAEVPVKGFEAKSRKLGQPLITEALSCIFNPTDHDTFGLAPSVRYAE